VVEGPGGGPPCAPGEGVAAARRVMAWGRDFSGVSWSAAIYAALLEAALLPHPHPPKAEGPRPHRAPRITRNFDHIHLVLRN
jgi:hypothetical protein